MLSSSTNRSYCDDRDGLTRKGLKVTPVVDGLKFWPASSQCQGMQLINASYKSCQTEATAIDREGLARVSQGDGGGRWVKDADQLLAPRRHNPKECTSLLHKSRWEDPVQSIRTIKIFNFSILSEFWILQRCAFSGCPRLSQSPCLCLVKLFWRLWTNGRVERIPLKYGHELAKAPVEHQIYFLPTDLFSWTWRTILRGSAFHRLQKHSVVKSILILGQIIFGDKLGEHQQSVCLFRQTGERWCWSRGRWHIDTCGV